MNPAFLRPACGLGRGWLGFAVPTQEVERLVDTVRGNVPLEQSRDFCSRHADRARAGQFGQDQVGDLISKRLAEDLRRAVLAKLPDGQSPCRWTTSTCSLLSSAA